VIDIFARKPAPLPANRAPAKQYDVFIKAFEKRVTAAQEQIEKLRAMERWYDCCKQALETVALPNEHDLNLSGDAIVMSVRALPADRLATFERLVEAVGGSLKAAGLRDDPTPARSMGGCYCDIDFVWRQWRPQHRSVILAIKLPETGIADVLVQQRTRTTETIEYVLTVASAPDGIAPPANFRTVREEIQEVVF
jgi:hypothetical protein